MRSAGMPDELRRRVLDAYAHLGGDAGRDERVVVRSSATAEDTASTSFAGMNETFTNVRGGLDVIDRIVDCWASLWSPRVVAYRATRALADEPAIAVVVQRMVGAGASGVMFTADPATGDRSCLVIEAAYGLGEVVVGGQVEPDTYVVSKDGPRILHEHIGTKDTKIVRGPDGHDQRLSVPAGEQAQRVLAENAVMTLAQTGIEIERHYGAPQDVEFAIDGHRVWIVQSRPITTLGDTATGTELEPPDTLLVSGLAAAPGVAAGPVRILRSPADGARQAAGEVLVAPMTNPDWVPTMRRAAALVTDGGGVTCHAAIVGRELLPAIVSVSLSTGSRRLARRRVLVKRLVTIDLGNIEVLFTDKTGTLTEGTITSPPRSILGPARGRAAGAGPGVQRGDTHRRWAGGRQRLGPGPVVGGRCPGGSGPGLRAAEHPPLRPRAPTCLNGRAGHRRHHRAGHQGRPEAILAAAPMCPTPPRRRCNTSSTTAPASLPSPPERPRHSPTRHRPTNATCASPAS